MLVKHIVRQAGNMLSFLNLDDNVRLETRSNVCAIINLSTNSFH